MIDAKSERLVKAMAWKIVFLYKDGGNITVSKREKKLSKEMAKYYQKQYARPSNDGGMVYHHPFRQCAPVPLTEYIERLE